jgi:hypothetical protein
VGHGESMSVEEWRSVVGFEGSYEVSSIGRVRSLDRGVTYQKIDQYSGRTITVTKHLKGRMLRPGVMKSGHLIVILGRKNNALVHHLVLKAFVGPQPPQMECCHGDGSPANNEVENLRWDTRLANVHDMIRHGTMYRRRLGDRINA